MTDITEPGGQTQKGPDVAARHEKLRQRQQSERVTALNEVLRQRWLAKQAEAADVAKRLDAHEQKMRDEVGRRLRDEVEQGLLNEDEAELKLIDEVAQMMRQKFWYSRDDYGFWTELPSQPVIHLRDGQTYVAVELVLEHMRKDPELFDFGDALHKVADGRRSALDKETVLTHHIANVLAFTQDFRMGKKVVVKNVDPPSRIAQTAIDMKAARGLCPLNGMITAPTLRADGSILQEAGYDEATGLFLAPAGVLPAIPEEPTQMDVRAALGVLLAPFRLFDFVSPADRGSMLAALLTSVCRGSLETAPAFGFDAPDFGAGKTKLATCVALMAGVEKPGVAQPSTLKDEDEMRKFVTAELMRGSQAMLFDNVTGLITSSTLAALLTSETYVDRKLGTNESFSLPSRAMVMATGKNMLLAEDMVRRFLTVKVDPGVEDPQLRDFDFDPVEVVKEDRMQLVAAALTLMRGRLTLAGGRRWPAVGSYETWSWLVLDTVRWIAEQDDRIGNPLDTQVRAKANDPVKEAHGLLLQQFATAFGTDANFRSDDVFKVLQGGMFSPLGGKPKVPHAVVEATREAWEARFGHEKSRTTIQVGRNMGHLLDTVVDGLVLRQGYDARAKVRLWRIEAVKVGAVRRAA